MNEVYVVWAMLVLSAVLSIISAIVSGNRLRSHKSEVEDAKRIVSLVEDIDRVTESLEICITPPNREEHQDHCTNCMVWPGYDDCDCIEWLDKKIIDVLRRARKEIATWENSKS